MGPCADLELDEHVGVLSELASPSQVRAPEIMEVAAVGWAGTQAGVHLAEQQHDGQLDQVGPIKARLLCSL